MLSSKLFWIWGIYMQIIDLHEKSPKQIKSKLRTIWRMRMICVIVFLALNTNDDVGSCLLLTSFPGWTCPGWACGMCDHQPALSVCSPVLCVAWCAEKASTFTTGASTGMRGVVLAGLSRRTASRSGWVLLHAEATFPLATNVATYFANAVNMWLSGTF